MFEKSLYDLIKGLRNHKGAEEDYIQGCLRECRAEIKSQDMDKKATALLKLIYLEMFGYDMSWASFHVLEVMSSAKYLQKRAGYLGAVQSFRPETEVLMLATNLLKKDLISSSIPNMSLPLITLPNIITPSLAMSLLPDILPRISHSHALVRKKAVVCLYRLALVYPEALKLAWPKLKDRLMNDEEDTSVTTAVLNVVCELGWRRPHDFLPLAPRFFELLVEGGNNWMAIKIIKLFATLTPLEPRLVKKLIRPLVNIIQTTTAMSLLYECINGIIQGGILDGEGGLEEKDEIASLCVGKLRGMIVTDFDPNLKYVALLAFSRIVSSYPYLVSTHQDVIMDCLDDADISIRLQALELAARMVNEDTLQLVVNRLITQLRNARHMTINDGHGELEDVSELGDLTERKEPGKRISQFSMPNDYRLEVLHRILDICSSDNYSRLGDFEWYIDVLVQLVKLLPTDVEGTTLQYVAYQATESDSRDSITGRVGSEIRNIAVRVKDVRMEATRAAESLMLIDDRQSLFAGASNTDSGLLGPLAWVIGEFAEYLSTPGMTLHSLIDVSNISLPARTLSLFIHATPKVLVRIIRDYGEGWNTLRKSEISLFLARTIEFLELLASHPDLDVQERAIEFLEVMRLAADVIQTEAQQNQAPVILYSVIPGLFCGLELNPVAPNAQKKVPLPDELSLHRPFNHEIRDLFEYRLNDLSELGTQVPFNEFYYVREISMTTKPQNDFGTIGIQTTASYQNSDASFDGATAISRYKVERRERNKDDPFYIGTDDPSVASAQFDEASSTAIGDGLDLDSIPIIDLKIGAVENQLSTLTNPSNKSKKLPSQPRRYNIVPDEVLGIEEPADFLAADEPTKARRSLLQVDSSGLKTLSLGADVGPSYTFNEASRRIEDDAEMATAMKEVEKIRLQMQRASERVHLEGVPTDGTLVKKKRKAKTKRSTVTEPREAGASKHNDDILENDKNDGQHRQRLSTAKKKKVQKDRG